MFFFVLQHNPFLELLTATKSAWDFLGVNFLVQGFFWVLTYGSIRSSPSLEIPSTPPGHTRFQVYTYNYTTVFIQRGKRRSMQNKVQLFFAVRYNPELLTPALQLREGEFAIRERCYFPAFSINIIIQDYKSRCFWNRLLGVENKTVVLEKTIEKNSFLLIIDPF